MIFKVEVEWPWRYRSRSKVITCDTPSQASDHLYQIWKESIQNCRRYRADRILKESRSRPNDLENIGQGQRSFHATHPLMLMMICAKSGKNASRIVDFFSRWKPKYKKNPSRPVDATEWTRFSKSRSNELEDIGQGQRSSHATHLLMLVIICTKYEKNPSRTVDATERTRFSRPRPNDLEDIGQGHYMQHTFSY